MALRTKRSYELKIGLPVVLEEGFFTPLQDPNDRVVKLTDYAIEQPSDSYLINEHEMKYRVTFTNDTKKNTCDITVVNLLPSTIQYVLANRDKNLYIELNVGYNGELKPLFKGTLKSASPSRNGTDTLLRLIVVDGVVNNEAYTTRSYPKGTPYNRIVQDLRKDLSVPVGRMVDIPPEHVTPTNISLFGQTYEKMSAITGQFDYDFTIVNGACYSTPKLEMLQESAAFLSPETGLLSDVLPLIKTGKSGKQTDTTTNSLDRVSFRCQTDASIKPPLSVYLEDKDNGVDGVYKVEKAAFTCGSFETGSFEVLVHCVKSDALVAV